MDPEGFNDFSTVQEAAREGLREGRFVEGSGPLAWRFVELPSFGDAVAWDVRMGAGRRDADAPRLVRSRWCRARDAREFGSPVERLRRLGRPRPFLPTIEAETHPVDPAWVSAFLQRLRSVPIPLAIARPRIGLDGTTYELIVGDAFCRSRIAWWCSLPDEWAGLGPILDEMLAVFESIRRGPAPSDEEV